MLYKFFWPALLACVAIIFGSGVYLSPKAPALVTVNYDGYGAHRAYPAEVYYNQVPAELVGRSFRFHEEMLSMRSLSR
jgi:hypothetical protein